MEMKEAFNASNDSSCRSVRDGDCSAEIKVPTIDDFNLLKPISKGAFGKVFLGCKKGRPEKVYAIKVMRKSDMINKNLKHQVITERDAMARSESPFVVQLYYSIQTLNNIFLVMEYLIGGDVKSLLTVCGFFDEPMAVMYVAEVTLALEYLHNKGIIHRDLKPDNMLITAEGHIKLTDFGLSKFSMSFNAGGQEVPMTPKTPLPYSYRSVDNYRTPGQILSLRSNLAFSTGKFSAYDGSYSTTPEVMRSAQFTRQDVSNKPSDSPGSTPNTSRLQSGKVLTKQMSMRDKLLTKSTSMYIQDVQDTTVLSSSAEEKMTPSFASSSRPPVKRLMSTMQDSLNWTESTGAGQTTDHSSVNISNLSSVPPASESTGLSECCLDSPESFRTGSLMSTEKSSKFQSTMFGQDTELSDNVFEPSEDSVNVSEHMDVSLPECHTGGSNQEGNSATMSQCGCSGSTGMELKCECRSHLKAPSRQEKITDDTPQMHRTEESVWNSYAAKNLRSLRQGSYEEDSEEGELVGNKENIRAIFNDPSSPERCPSEVFRKRCELKSKAKPRRLMKTKSFCYPSDDESDGYELNRYKDRSIARKRNFCHVEVSPVRRTHSADSGLTAEFRFLRFGTGEPHTKRSHSIPRTRIRFHSGNDRIKLTGSKLLDRTDTQKSNKPTECLSKMMDGMKNLSDSDKLTSLSADETRLLEEHSDTSVSEADKNTSMESAEQSTNIYESGATGSHVNVSQDMSEVSGMMPEPGLEKETNFSFNNIGPNEPLMGGSRNIFPLCNKRLAHLKKPMVSSLASEGEIDRRSPNLSSVHELDSEMTPAESADLDSSVFEEKHNKQVQHQEEKEDNKPSTPPVSTVSTPGALLPPPPPRVQHQEEKEDKLTTPPVSTVSTPGALLPPPPPRSRRKSGKPLPPALKFAPTAHYIEPRSRHSSGSSDAAMTPKTPLRQKVGFLTPNIKCAQTPRTPVQMLSGRSQSFCQGLKTPYRTPKSVRRAPAPDPNEERILGTPDYLAPEILHQKSHGPAVDWWALGICMFEFLTGVPPFNDQTPNLVFNNILNRDIPWPEGEEALSEDSREAIDILLTMDPHSRPGGSQVRKMGVFRDVDWHNLLDIQPTFIPEPDDMMDTTYFDARNDLLNLCVSDVDF